MKKHKFKIGDIVHHRLKGYVRQMSDPNNPQKGSGSPFLILDRVTTECSGGIQLSYNCRMGATASGSLSTVNPERLYNIMEIELEV